MFIEKDIHTSTSCQKNYQTEASQPDHLYVPIFPCLQLIQKRLSLKNDKPQTLSAQGIMDMHKNKAFDGPITQ